MKAQIHLGLHERQGAALTNFAEVLEPDDAENALAATKDPYMLDFLNLAKGAKNTGASNLQTGDDLADQAELAQLDEVRARLEDRVARHTR